MPQLSQTQLDIIRLTHARQLRQLAISPAKEALGSKKPTDLPPPTPAELLAYILQWIQDNPGALRGARDTQCKSSSPDSPNWDAVFLSFIESCAVYLRKDDEVTKATLAARAGDYDKAVDHLRASQEDIDIVARALGCTFVQLCDFAEQSPEEALIQQSGAFAGVFIGDDAEKPFMGIAFKGSDNRDTITDLKWHPLPALQRPEIVWGAPTHRGFYFGLFGRFAEQEDSQAQIPFDS
ncbi:hypothetical protein BV20DRAFT_977164 [Pilatotrama ljubarskyi]|nr:hypothetical protein BV20DRAFT_977164 [Pilatotrama ljubarskyi]